MTLTPELAPLFWEQQERSGIKAEDIDSGRVRDLGRRLCQFMQAHTTEVLQISIAEVAEV